MSDHWQNINNGMKVELDNHLCDLQAFWIATVVKIAGWLTISLNYMPPFENTGSNFMQHGLQFF